MATPRKRPARPAPVTPKIVLLTTVGDFAATRRPALSADEALQGLRDRALFIHDAQHENTLFDALPEKGDPTEAVESILDELEDFAAEYGEVIENLLGPGQEGRALEWGLHAEASLADVTAQFQREGFQIQAFPPVE